MNRATWMPEVDVEADVQPAPLRAEWERVSLEACARYGVTGSGLRDSRTARATMARFWLWSTLRDKKPIGWSLSEIARFAERHHTTVADGIKVHTGRERA